MAPNTTQTPITVRGPFWEAEAVILAGGFPSGAGLVADSTTGYFRTLFVEANPRTAFGLAEVHLPGTVLALAFIRQVRAAPVPSVSVQWTRANNAAIPTLTTEEQIKTALADGSASLLLLQAKPDDLAAGKRDFTCIGGEIRLDATMANALKAVWDACRISDVDRAALHGSGISIHGKVSLPWETDRLKTWTLLSLDQPAPAAAGDRLFRLSLEHDRLTVAELVELRQSWQNLSIAVNPRHPRNGFSPLATLPSTPTWVTFELSDPLAAPHFYWLLQQWTGATPTSTLHFDTSEVAVLLTDQNPYPRDDDPEPTSLAQVISQDVQIGVVDADTLRITMLAGTTPAIGAETLTYGWQRSGQSDHFSSPGLKVAFDPIQTAEFLRRTQQLPTPLLPRDEEGGVLGHPFKPEQAVDFPDYFDGAKSLPLLDPAVIWGFMPLEDGWAQLPVLNLTDQVYIDLKLAKPVAAPEDRQPVLRGAVYLGNDDPAVLAGFCDEQPWNMTLVDARQVSGTWELKRGAEGFQLTQVDLTVSTPDLFINGMLWLSTGYPTAEDALPDLSKWATALRQIPLRTLDQADDVFPALIRLALSSFGFTLRPEINFACGNPNALPANVASAQLQPLSFHFEVDEANMAKMFASNDELFQDDDEVEEQPIHAIPPALPQNTFSQHLPLIWRRHPRLPMVQALPLTQSRHAPNYPNASRQLVPYALSTSAATETTPPLPNADWTFAVAGAGAWPKLTGNVSVAQEWIGKEKDGKADFYDLPLVSLSLPGLELDPNPGAANLGLLPDADLTLTPQLRFDLPYLDQIMALAQLPKPVRSPGQTSPLPDQPPPLPPKPLMRDSYMDYWRTLAEKANLASADAVDVLLRQDGGQTVVQYLIEPLLWNVKPELDLMVYPGSFDLSNETGDAALLTLTEEAALRGIDGAFSATDGTLRRLPDAADASAYQITAGSMAAHFREGAVTAYRDQRGLFRSAAAVVNTALIKTPVSLQLKAGTSDYELASLRQPLQLTIAAGQSWAALWFRDLPLNAATQKFTRTSTQMQSPEVDPASRDLDINDPDAMSRDYNVLAGYQWNVRDASAIDTVSLKLGGLHIHPLTLEEVTVTAGQVARIVLIARVQLPINGYQEFADLSNAVRFTFDAAGAATGTLPLTEVALIPAQGEWPLALNNGELTEAPQLVWTQIALTPDHAGLIFSNVRAEFYLFDVAWSVRLEPITFSLTAPLDTMEIRRDFPADEAALLLPESLKITLDMVKAQEELPPLDPNAPPPPPSLPHQAVVALRVRLGERRQDEQNPGGVAKNRAALDARVLFTLIGKDKPKWEDAALFHDLRLSSTEPQSMLLYKQHTLQFQWSTFSARDGLTSPLELLPGMPLALLPAEVGATSVYAPVPGFATLRFDAVVGAEIPTLTLTMAFIEALLTCRWGSYLSDQPPTQPIKLEQSERVFGSSAGDVVFAYTSSYPNPKVAVAAGEQPILWDDSFMLNGFVEVKNLISWAMETHYDAAQQILELPPARGSRLDHLRHSIRILFNQHEILPSLPAIGADHLLFNFVGKPWQFLTVVEHQLAALKMSETEITITHERRWTALQEVRFAAVAHFRDFLVAHANDHFIAPFFQSDVGAQLALASGSDDVNQAGTGANDFLAALPAGPTQGMHWIGNIQSGRSNWTGFRFANVAIEKGAKIASATLEFTPAQNSTMPFRAQIHADRTGNSAPFANNARPSDRPETAAKVYYPLDQQAWQAGVAVQSPDITKVIQEIVNRNDWSPGNALSIIIQGTAGEDPDDPLNTPGEPRRFIYGRELDPTRAVKLVITYEAKVAPLDTYGLFTPQLRELVLNTGTPHELDALPNTMLIVEASAPFWLKQQAEGEPILTALQYLPNGTQLAMLSNPDDYAPPNDTDSPLWQLLIMPFLGRLQSPASDATGNSAFVVDPVLLMGRLLQNAPGQALAPLLLALTNRGDDSAVTFDVSPFETLVSQSMARLDRSTLQENWFRLQQLTPEPTPKSLPSIIAALPNTPARLSRDVSLRRMFDSLRRQTPPQTPPASDQLPALIDDAMLLWRQSADPDLVLANPATDPAILRWQRATLLLWQGTSRARQSNRQFYGWHLVGLQLASLFAAPDAPTTVRYLAATLHPSWNTTAKTLSVSFTVSPYLGLSFLGGEGTRALELEVIELLAINPGTNILRPVASFLREENSSAARQVQIDTWAADAHQRLAPESPIAVVRSRQVNSLSNAPVGSAVAVTSYAYEIIDVATLSTGTARRSLRLRTSVPELRFRQGQFSSYALADDLKSFEIAPPQTIGVQPIYAVNSPTRKVDTPEGKAKPEWPWGFSGLRLSVQYTQAKQGIVGAHNGKTGGSAPDSLILWWQSVQYGLQYRPATGDVRPAASLPSHFRAAAIKSLLPVNSNVPMPELEIDTVINEEPPRAGAEDAKPPAQHERWQAVLPGRLRYVVVGSRPGVPFAFRHYLLRQKLQRDKDVRKAQQWGSLVVSGSLPVQHRSPRPVPLPANLEGKQEISLQPWSSYFEPTQNASFTVNPADETFLAPCGDDPARRLRVRLLSPEQGLILPTWKGEITVALEWNPTLEGSGDDWRVSFLLVGNGKEFTLDSDEGGIYHAPGTYLLRLPNREQQQQVSTLEMHIRARAELVDMNGTNLSGFTQTVELPLFYTDDATLRLPLEPVFAHFEDPEYNRLLGSATGYALSLLEMECWTDNTHTEKESVSHEVRVSLDRKAYNPTSEIAFRYDWDDASQFVAATAQSVTLSHISGTGTTVVIKTWDGAAAIAPGAIRIESLPALVGKHNDERSEAEKANSLPMVLRAGDRLQLKAVFVQGLKPDNTPILAPVSVEVDLVDEPVIPAPEAAYALLRQRNVATEAEAIVETARFAWNPDASRVELVCSEDLKNAFVRRRAVFQWQDSARPNRNAKYAVQKIAANGSTHLPPFSEVQRSTIG